MEKILLKNNNITFKDMILNRHFRIMLSKAEATKLKSYGLTVKEKLIDFKSIDGDHKKFRKDHKMGPRDRKIYSISVVINPESMIFLFNSKNKLEGLCTFEDSWRFRDFDLLKAKNIYLKVYEVHCYNRDFCLAHVDTMIIKATKKQLDKRLYSGKGYN